MEKVKLTKSQAEEIEMIKRVGHPVYWKENGWLIERSENLVGLSFQAYMNAIYKGYEVEPEFNLGDVLFNTRTNKVFRAQQGDLDSINISVNKKHLRHATKQEIWWFENRRGVWELKKGDIIRKFVVNGAYYEVTHVDGEHIGLFDIGRSRIETEEIDIVSGGYRVVCFADHRKDI